MSLNGWSEIKQKITGQTILDGRSVIKQKITGQTILKQIVTGHVTIGTVLDDPTQTFILVDEDGNEVPAVLVDEEVTLTATANDIRIDTTAVTEAGVTVGEKVIPAYHTTEGMVYVLPGEEFEIMHLKEDCEFTKLQALFCIDSVSVQKVSIDSKVYNVNSTDAISTITIDTENQIVKFGLVNTDSVPYMLRYFTYREEI